MPVYIPIQLTDAAEQVQKGEMPKATTREFIGWFSAARRTSGNVYRIRASLAELKLKTEPDFESAFIDGEIRIRADEATQSRIRDIAELTYGVSKLSQANRPPVPVKPDALLSEAVTIMLQNDFSQLPVMQSDRHVNGLVTWKSIATKLALGRKCQAARDCMEQHVEVKYADSLFRAIPLITLHECVLVRSDDNRICGIITASDITAQFENLGEPFLLLGEIENYIRHFIDGVFTLEELAAVKDPRDVGREINGVWDLTFGEYVRLVENEERWTKIGLPLDRKAFVDGVDCIRRIRNDVLHFDPDGITPEDLEELRKFAKFLQRLDSLGIPKGRA